MRFVKLLLLTAAYFCVSSLCAAQVDRITGPIEASRKVVFPGHVHPLAKPEYDQGQVESTLPFGSVTLVMAPSPAQQAALNQLLAEQQDRTSANFHKWITPEQYADRFGLSPSDMNKISAWLQSQGFSIVRLARGRNAVVFSGTAAQIESAFNTEIHRYSINGEMHIANATPISLPAALIDIVTNIRGLTNFRYKPMYVRPSPGALASAHPRYTTTIDGNTDYLLAPGDIATMYDLSPLYSASTPIDGTGEKLAIIGQTDIYLDDINYFRQGFGFSTIPSTTTVTAGECLINSSGIVQSTETTQECNTTYFNYILAGTDYGVSLGDLIEADLDLEWSGAIAYNAQIVFVNAPINSAETSGGVDVALEYAIDNDVAPVISMSYGICEYYGGTLETELSQAGPEGITVMNSAGDTGSAACDNSPPGTTSTSSPPLPYTPAQGGQSVNYPASSVYVTGVGGTSIPLGDFSSQYWGGSNATNGGSALSALVGQEAAWNDDAAFAQACAGDPTNSFCENGGPPAVKGWVALGASATAQQVQEDIWLSIGGGGVSDCYNPALADLCVSGFARPTWQQSLSLSSLSSQQSSYRLVPDVALLASPNYPGFIICTPVEELSSTSPYDTETTSSCQTSIADSADGTLSGGTFVIDPSIVGGTSAASPIFAGIVTLLNQYLNNTPPNGLGNINSMLYAIAQSPGAGAFHNIVSGNNDVYCDVGYPAGDPTDVICPSTGVFGFSTSTADSDPTTGYNPVGGLGSVDANALALAWAAYLDPDFTLTASTLNPTSVPAGQSTTTTLTLAPVATSTGMVVNFASTSCIGLPSGATCSFSPSSVTFTGSSSATVTLTISTTANMALPSTAPTVSIVPSNAIVNPPATVSLDLTKTNQSFAMATADSTYSVGVGGTASIQVNVTGQNGFVTTSNNTTVLPITYSCSGIATSAEISCQPQGNGQATNATTVTVNLVTTAATSKLNHSPFERSPIFYAALLPGVFGLFFMRPRLRTLRFLSLIMFLGLSTLWLGSCGGSSKSSTGPSSLQNGGTPPGNYTVTLNGTTGGANPLTSSVTITLTVAAQ
jgi:hypothetical protein